MLRQKQYDLVIENVLWRDFIGVRMLNTRQSYVTAKRHTRTRQYGWRSTRSVNSEKIAAKSNFGFSQ